MSIEKEKPEEIVKITPIIPRKSEESRLATMVPVKQVVQDLTAQSQGLTPKEAANKAVCNAALKGMFENMDPSTQRFTKGLELYSIINQAQV